VKTQPLKKAFSLALLWQKLFYYLGQVTSLNQDAGVESLSKFFK